uniref:Reverse transcriptase Ty1/copia-type domain-containing protein n=1 Tax=Tanacetum cinerariifolium TaxID=118510 RepID=A0A6L2JAW1_TANCI|nr:hypothetical protein [Tanacetum cinerariifolium]
MTFDEGPPPTKLSPLVDDDVGEEEAIENNTKTVNNNNKEDKSIEVDEDINIKESKNHPLDNLDLSKVAITLQAKALDLSFGIQQVYLQHEHYALWEVIEFGDSYKAPPEETAKDKGLAGEVFALTKKKGRTMAITAEDMQKRKNDIDNDDIEEMDIKWNLALLSMRADRFWKKTESANHQGVKIEGRERERESYKKDPKEDEALKNHALVADEEKVPAEYALMVKSRSSSDNKKDLSWIGLPEFVDDTVTDYTRPTPSIDVSKSVSKELEERWKSNNPSFFEQGGSSGNVVSMPMIKFVIESGCPNATKFNNTKNARKPTGIQQDNIDDKVYWDSGYSRHMTGNISYLYEYEPFNGRYVSFGHGRGKITGKGSIKTDLSGLNSVSSLNHKWYCLVVTDDFSRSYNGDEFRNKEMDELCLRKAGTMLADAKLPVTFWAEAVNTACYVQNKVLVIKPCNKTPYKLFNERSPAIGFLIPFGCHVMILNTLDHLGKFDAKRDEEQEEVNRDKEVLETSGNSNPIASTKVFTNDSFELDSSSTVETKVPTISTPILTGTLSVPSVTSSVLRIISRGGSSYPEPLSLGNAMSFENRLEDLFRDTSNAVSLNDVEANLSNIETAIQVSPTSTLRILKDHPKSQIIGLIDTHVQTRQKAKNVLVDCPKGVRPIGMKWVLKNKKDERGIVIRNKERLVAQEHTQEEGIDNEEAFVPVARIEAIRLFLAYASYMGFTVYQMDVRSSFLYRTINEEVYLMQPLDFQYLEFPHRVYKVEKAMYGLHQAPRAWYGTLSKYLLDNSFQRDDNVADLLTKVFDVRRFQYLVITFQEPTIPSQSHSVITTPRRITKGTIRISQSKVPSPRADETAFPIRDARYGEAFPTVTSLDLGQDRENIAKTSAMPHEASPRVTSLRGGEGNKDIVKDSDKSADKGSDNTDDIANVLGTLGVANILASRGLRSVFTTGSLSVATASTIVSSAVAIASGSFPAIAIFTTASVATPTTRVTRSSRGVIIESSSPISVNIPSISKKDKGKGTMTEPE